MSQAGSSLIERPDALPQGHNFTKYINLGISNLYSNEVVAPPHSLRVAETGTPKAVIDAFQLYAILTDPRMAAMAMVGTIWNSFTDVTAKDSTPSVQEVEFHGARTDRDVLAFCRERNLHYTLTKAIDLAGKCFDLVERPRIILDSDPEDGDEYLVLGVRVGGGFEDNLKAYHRYVEEWSEATEWDTGRLIRLDYTMATL